MSGEEKNVYASCSEFKLIVIWIFQCYCSETGFHGVLSEEMFQLIWGSDGDQGIF